jgi:hypothetical protein
MDGFFLMKLHTFRKSVKKMQVLRKYGGINGTSHESQYTFLIISRSFHFTWVISEVLHTVHVWDLKINLFYKIHLQAFNVISIVLYHSGPTFVACYQSTLPELCPCSKIVRSYRPVLVSLSRPGSVLVSAVSLPPSATALNHSSLSGDSLSCCVT